MTRIDDAMKCILDAETEYRGHPYDIRDDDLRRWLEALDADGHLLPDLPEPDGYNYGLPWWGACDTEVRPAGYEQRVICTDENGPWETSAADARAFAYALLAAADYAERNQEC